MIEHELIKTAVIAPFTAKTSELTPLMDPEEVQVVILGAFDDPEDTEWAALPFLFAVAALSFEDARPRGLSADEFNKNDQLSVADFLPQVRFTGRGLQWHGDYLKGRRIKTMLRTSSDGLFEIHTWERGEAATRWLGRLQGKKPLQAVAAQ